MIPKSEESDIKARQAALEEGLKGAGIRLTHQRLEVCREIASSRDHPDAEAVFKGVRQRVPTISLDTVYRTLWTLNELGLIKTLGTPRERTRFDGNTDKHHHFVCSRCGKAWDFYSPEFDSLSLPDDIFRIGTPSETQVEVRGICQSCASDTRQNRGRTK